MLFRSKLIYKVICPEDLPMLGGGKVTGSHPIALLPIAASKSHE